MKPLKKAILLGFLLMIATCSAFSQKGKVAVISNDTREHKLAGAELQILEDPSKELTINDIISPAYQDSFKVNTKKFPDIRNIKSAYWVKFTLRSKEDLQKNFVLENADLHIDQFEFYAPDDDGNYSEPKQAGYTWEFNKRPFQHKNFVFQLEVKADQPQTYYVRATSRNHNPFIFLVRSYHQFAQYSLTEYYLLGLFYGILVIMAIYNFLLFLSVKEKVYLYYVVYVMCCAMITLAEDGTGFQYIWPQWPEFNTILGLFGPLMLLMSFTVYAKAFLNLKGYVPKINRMIDLVNGVYIGFFFLDAVWLHLEWDFPFYFIPFSLIYIGSFICLKRGFRPARYFIIGYSFMFLSIIFLIFRMSGIIHWDDIFTVYSFNIGLVFEIVILSIALGDRIKIIKQEKESALLERQKALEENHKAQQKIIEQLQENEALKDKVNRELEEKVSERTYELQEANEKLQKQAEEINRMNLLLDEDNRKLQKNVKELTKARVMMRDLDFTEFGTIFPDKAACLKYLADMKWKDGYECKKCGHEKYCDGKEHFSRRCTRCRYDESPTAFTIFHRLKFPITKAFYLLFLVYANNGKITSNELSDILQLRQSTCWSFRKKVLAAMKSKKKQLSEDDIDGWGQLVFNAEK